MVLWHNMGLTITDPMIHWEEFLRFSTDSETVPPHLKRFSYTPVGIVPPSFYIHLPKWETTKSIQNEKFYFWPVLKRGSYIAVVGLLQILISRYRDHQQTIGPVFIPDGRLFRRIENNTGPLEDSGCSEFAWRVFLKYLNYFEKPSEWVVGLGIEKGRR